MRKIAVITGARSEYGLLYSVMREIQNSAEFELQIIVTGMHLSPEYGSTFQEIEKDGFVIHEKLEMLLSSDTRIGVAKSIGLGVIGFSDVFNRLRPDLIMVLGDRYEILAAAQAALIMKIPIAHIAGGDTTEGAFDESIRHSITKMAHLHFVTNEIAQKRVIQLGENPHYVYNVGSPGIDLIRKTVLFTRNELEQELGFQFLGKNLLITFHPVTLDQKPSTEQFQALLNALEALGRDIGIVFTKPNSDPEGRAIITMIDKFVASHRNSHAFISIGQRRYLSLVSHVDAVVGNSSSGLYEVPSFKKPTVNIGNRQNFTMPFPDRTISNN